VTERPESVTLIAIYQFVTGTILLLFSCLLAAAAFPAFLFTVGRAEDVLLVTVLGAGALSLLITIGAASFAVGWGLLQMRRWARLGAIVLAVFALIGFPVWTIAAAFVLIYLIGPEGRTAFGLTPLEDEPALETEPRPEPEVVPVPEAEMETNAEPATEPAAPVEPAEPTESPEPEAWPEPEVHEKPPARFAPPRSAHSARPKRRPSPTDDVSGPRRIITPGKRVFGTHGSVDSDAESTHIMESERTRHLPLVEREMESERTRRVEPTPDDEGVTDEPPAEGDRPDEQRRRNG
jgi:hypothetical protein